MTQPENSENSIVPFTVPSPWRVFELSDLMRSEKGSVVYAWKRGEIYLYVGFSRNPLARIGSHDIVGKAAPFLPHDKILIWKFPTRQKGMEFEAAMIRTMRPMFNVSSNPNFVRNSRITYPCIKCGVEFRPMRPWQKFCSQLCRHLKMNTDPDLEKAIRERAVSTIVGPHPDIRVEVLE